MQNDKASVELLKSLLREVITEAKSTSCLSTSLINRCYARLRDIEGKPMMLERGNRVSVNGTSGFSRGSRGVVQFVEPSGNVWVLRDGAGSPCLFSPMELDLE